MRTYKVGANLLLQATLLTHLHQHTKFERDRFSRSRDLEGPLPWTCSRAVAPQLWHMYMHAGWVPTYMPSFSAIDQVVTNILQYTLYIATKRTPIRFARVTCIRGQPHHLGIVQYLVEGMKLPYKNYRM